MTRQEKYRKNHPWVNNLFQARRRCNDPKHFSYQWYGARGIKCMLTVAEAKQLWERDKAAKLKKPTLDRIDNDGPYAVWNCRFIENKENVSSSNMRRKWNENKKMRKETARWTV